VTAVGNDYGYEAVFVRQIAAHAREGDVLLALSTSGRSPNVVAAAAAARERGVTVYALTGPVPNPLADAADDAVGVATSATPVIQEVHQVAIHLVCDSLDRSVQIAESHGWDRDA
jgi:D-sedoheptulose 7-phosphate isomerase